MITGELKSKIDSVWDDFWSGGISNPLEVMEQLTYMLFIKGLDETQTSLNAKRTAPANQSRTRSSLKATDPKGRPYADLRWHNFKNMGSAKDMYQIVDEHVFAHMHALAEGSTHAAHMEDARLTIPTPALLQKVVDGLDAIPMADRDTKGDVYEYMLSKIATAGQNGQFRTPRHIIQLMVNMWQPDPDDLMCDPASGTCGFMVAASEYIRDNHPEALHRPAKARTFPHQNVQRVRLRQHHAANRFHEPATPRRQNPSIAYRDSLAEDADKDAEAYSLILANPPFAGSLDYEGTSKDLLQVVKTKKTELLFMALFLRLLKPGGRAAVIVPDGVLFGSTKAHKELRRMLVEDQKLDGIISLPSGVFKPYAGVSTAILLFTKTNSGGTDNVWFYDLQADGLSLDDKRTPLLDETKLGAIPTETLTERRPRQKQPPRRPRPLAPTRHHRSMTVPAPTNPSASQSRHRRQRLRPQHQPVQRNRLRRNRLPRPHSDS